MGTLGTQVVSSLCSQSQWLSLASDLMDVFFFWTNKISLGHSFLSLQTIQGQGDTQWHSIHLYILQHYCLQLSEVSHLFCSSYFLACRWSRLDWNCGPRSAGLKVLAVRFCIWVSLTEAGFRFNSPMTPCVLGHLITNLVLNGWTFSSPTAQTQSSNTFPMLFFPQNSKTCRRPCVWLMMIILLYRK